MRQAAARSSGPRFASICTWPSYAVWVARDRDRSRDWSWTTERNRRVRAEAKQARLAWEARYPGVRYVAPGPYTHGLISTYEQRHCRCEPCEMARGTRNEAWRLSRRDTRQAHLPSDGQVWAACQSLDEMYPQGWTARQLSDMFGVSGRQLCRRLSALARRGQVWQVRTRPRVVWQISAVYRRQRASWARCGSSVSTESLCDTGSQLGITMFPPEGPMPLQVEGAGALGVREQEALREEVGGSD